MLVRRKGISTALVLGLGVAATSQRAGARCPPRTRRPPTPWPVRSGPAADCLDIASISRRVMVSSLCPAPFAPRGRSPRHSLALQSVAGVTGLIDQIQVTGDRGVRPVQYQTAFGGHGGGGGGGVIYDGTAAPMGAGSMALANP